MKSLLQNLLIFLAVCLCGLIAFQWHRETRLQQQVQTLTDTVHDKMVSIQDLQGMLKRTQEEVRRLDILKSALTETVKSNRLELIRLTADLEKANEKLAALLGKQE